MQFLPVTSGSIANVRVYPRVSTHATQRINQNTSLKKFLTTTKHSDDKIWVIITFVLGIVLFGPFCITNIKTK
jgi:hypothetical protein